MFRVQCAAEEVRASELGLKQDEVDAVVLAPPGRVKRAHAQEQVADVLTAPEHFGHAVVSDSSIEAVIPRGAGRDRVGGIAPLVVFVRDPAKLHGIRAGLQ